MRETQIIGLTKKAQDFVTNLEPMESDTFTYGMFEEEIRLRRWKYEHGCVREVVQTAPWSSGPMLFYCLEIDYNNGAVHRILQWIEDPEVKGREFDVESGSFWV